MDNDILLRRLHQTQPHVQHQVPGYQDTDLQKLLQVDGMQKLTPKGDFNVPQNFNVLNPYNQVRQVKKVKNYITCQVPSCSANLENLREYHQRYRICEQHQKSQTIVINSQPMRFCQQCGKFQPLDDFDGVKRNCRARLQRHNARRRKQSKAAKQFSLHDAHIGSPKTFPPKQLKRKFTHNLSPPGLNHLNYLNHENQFRDFKNIQEYHRSLQEKQSTEPPNMNHYQYSDHNLMSQYVHNNQNLQQQIPNSWFQLNQPPYGQANLKQNVPHHFFLQNQEYPETYMPQQLDVQNYEKDYKFRDSVQQPIYKMEEDQGNYNQDQFLPCDIRPTNNVNQSSNSSSSYTQIYNIIPMEELNKVKNHLYDLYNNYDKMIQLNQSQYQQGNYQNPSGNSQVVQQRQIENSQNESQQSRLPFYSQNHTVQLEQGNMEHTDTQLNQQEEPTSNLLQQQIHKQLAQSSEQSQDFLRSQYQPATLKQMLRRQENNYKHHI